MLRTKLFGRAALTLTLMTMLTACTQSADRMSGAALPQEAPPAAAGVDAGAASSDTLGVAPDASAGADVAAGAPEATGESEAGNPWGALAVAADQAAVEAVGFDASAAAAADAAALSDSARAMPAGLPSTGSPAACKTLLTPIDDALKAGGSLILAITIMPANGAYVGYAEGDVRRVPKPVVAGTPPRVMLEGNMWQQFSDRVAPDDGLITKCAGGPCPTPSGPVMPPSGQLFIKNRLDKLGVSMDVATGNTTLTLYSWNNAVVRLTPTCENGMFYGYGDGKLYAMTGRLTRPIPTRAPPRILP